MADVTVLYVNVDGSLTQLQNGDNLLADNLNRKSSSGNITIGGNVTGAGEDVVIGSALSATGEVLLGSVASQARVLGDLVVDGALGAALDAGDFAITNIGTSLELSNGAELRFYDVGDSNYLAFEAPALTANVVWILPATDSTGTQYLRSDGAGNLSWGTIASGGDVVGPASATDNAVCRFDTTTGKLIQSGGVTISDTDVVDGLTQLDFASSTATAGTINLPDGSAGIWGYGTGAQRRMIVLSSDGLTLWVGQDSGTGTVPTLDLEAGTTITFGVGGVTELSLTATALDLEGNDLNDVAQVNMTGATATAGDINLPDEGSIYSYGAVAARRMVEVIGSALFLGQNAGTGTVTAIDIEASDNIDLSIGAGDEVVFSVYGGFVQILEYGGTPSALRFYDGDTTNFVAFRANAAIGADITWILPATDSTGTQYLRSDGAGNLSWGTVSGGGGDVTGPASSTNNVICRFDEVTGKVIQGGGTDGVSGNPPVYDDNGNIYADCTGSTVSPISARVIGFNNLTVGTCASFQFGDANTGLQNGYDQCTQLYGWNPIVLMGDRSTVGAPVFISAPGFDYGTLVIGTTTFSVCLGVRGASGQSVNLQQWENSAGTVLVNVTSGGNLELNDHDITELKTATFNAEYAYAGGTTLNFSLGQKQGRTLTGSVTITTMTPPNGSFPGNCILRITQAATGGPYTVTFPAAVQWPGGTEPVMSPAAGSTTIYAFYYSGSIWYGVASRNFS